MNAENVKQCVVKDCALRYFGLEAAFQKSQVGGVLEFLYFWAEILINCFYR